MKGLSQAYKYLYKKYTHEAVGLPEYRMVDDERFSEYLSRALAHYEQITVDDDAYGVLYYRQLTEEGVTYIHTPVCGYYAQDEKTMVRLFQKLAEKVCTDGTYEFSVELYAHDSECIRTFHTNH